MSVHEKDEFFETPDVGDSDSDESYHSLAEELQNVTVDQSLNSVNAADSFEFYHKTPDKELYVADIGKRAGPGNTAVTSSENSESNQCAPEDSTNVTKVPVDNCDASSVRNTSPVLRNDKVILEANSPTCTTDLGDVEDLTEGVGEDAVVNCPAEGDLNDEEFDICNLSSVKTKDDLLELKLKDKEVDINLEEMKAAIDSAVEEKRAGNVLFTSGQYREAITHYNVGLETCPLGAPQDRAMLYHNRGVAYAKMGEHKLAVHSLTLALTHDPQYVKALARRATENEAAEDLDDAFKDYQSLLQLQPTNREAREAVVRLPPKIEERNEKLKAEMLGKLKDLGNMILKPFGMSTNDFQMQQDPKSGGYNLQFKKNP